jgi:hypothetical protein
MPDDSAHLQLRPEGWLFEEVRAVQDRHADEYERRITTKWVGNVIRRKLQLRPARASAGYVIPPEEFPKVDRLYGRYGVASGTGEAEPTAATPEPDFP